jgi:hypothetical protein
MTLLGRSNEIVACNVYISAGKPYHAQALLHVLESSQELCRQLRYPYISINDSNNHDDAIIDKKEEDDSSCYRVAVVHAYADGPYERSSLHLAGRPEFVAQVACHVAITAIDSLSRCHIDADATNHDDNASSKHPLVGLVDHISIMSLNKDTNDELQNNDKTTSSSTNAPPTKEDNDNDADDIQNDYIPTDAKGLAALSIIHELSAKGVICFPYGTADRDHTPLSIVRKEKTSFFHSGGLSEKELNQIQHSPKGNDPISDTIIDDSSPAPLPVVPPSSPSPSPLSLGICTIGSPSHFVENFNIRLSDKISKKQAMALTKKVRERDGGLLGVEALTLPYSHGRYEVACNLLRPDSLEGNADSILLKVEEWVQEQNDNHHDDINTRVKSQKDCVDDAYRVGTTMSQCLDVMDFDNEDMLRVHDSLVMGRFRNYALHGTSMNNENKDEMP